MSMTTMILLAVLSLAISCLVFGGMLWLNARLFRLSPIGFRRALLTGSLIIIVVLAVDAVYLFNPFRGALLPVVLLCLVVQLVIPFALIKAMLHASWGRAILVGVVTFVVPTGAMATAIFGEHVTVACSNCGYSHATGISAFYSRLMTGGPSPRIPLICPNCAHKGDSITNAQMVRAVPGDRLLADKVASVKRWNAIVFKDPRDGVTNFVMRLIGVPGEVLEIIDGDIYTAPVELLSEKEPVLVEELDRLRREARAYRETPRNEQREQSITDSFGKLNERLLPYLSIERKPPSVQRALWCPVYNHDFRPSAASQSLIGWQPGTEAAAKAWNTSASEITFSSDANDFCEIAFSGKPITDDVAYNGGPARRVAADTLPVSDVRVSFTWLPESGNGSLRLTINKDTDRFAGEIGMDGSVTLERQRPDLPGGKTLVGRANLRQPVVAGRAVRLELAVVDYRASLTVDGREWLATGNDYRPDLRRAVDISLQRGTTPRPTQVAIAARYMHGRVAHVVIERDVYYRCLNQMEPGLPTRNPFLDWPGWGTTGRPILLRTKRDTSAGHFPAEYFVLGDNSPASKDSRLWWDVGPDLEVRGEEYQIGTVPGDYLVGVARFVYWPMDRWHRLD